MSLLVYGIYLSTGSAPATVARFWVFVGGNPLISFKITELLYIGSAEKVSRGGRVWGVGFYAFSSGKLPNFQGKSPGIFPPIPPMAGTFLFPKSLKILPNEVFRFIQQPLYSHFN
ncbi:hypothetical protein [Microcystis sp. M025S2]|uniref:hypothetical protein n=1 Tax=Microcystis sp. M025S2 TaxID=2771161 RepID=UPI00258C73DD|nr:hypothetical protein [Microcystis sp. M025S2]